MVVLTINGLEEFEGFASGHNACSGCLEALVLRHVIKASGPNTIAVSATGCMEVISTGFPQTSWQIPWIHSAFENASAVASGIDAALKALGKRENVNIIVFGGDGATFDIGFQSLSGAMERGHKFLYIVTDNEAYANTGVQRSSATFPFANTTTTPAGKKSSGKLEPKKPLDLIMAAHGIPYIATATPANALDISRKVKKALSINAPTLLHVLSPCVKSWGYAGPNGVDLARLAIQTRVFPLMEIEKGVLTFTQKVEKQNARPVEEYLMPQNRFKHLTPDLTRKIQEYVNARYEFLESIEGKKAFDVLY
ncbi:MAG: thiamine pyrophosphate-dependent enzyme [Candidatus Diapherotrites archaeon]|nr:thiamine pyrophosphate-dependent enzyme [Candidatus Diapherotrites archaeon]